MPKLRIGTRKSPLALWQTEHVASLLRAHHADIEVEFIRITTEGDQRLDRALSELGGKGLFTTELEVALLEGRVDLAVHSYKDLPTASDARLAIASVPPRGVCDDAFVAPAREGAVTRLDELPRGATVATGSLRRRAQLLAKYPHLQVADVRGTVGTRLKKLDEEHREWQGMILARAGLERLGLQHRVSEVISREVMLSAVGQGALAVQARADDAATRSLVAVFHDAATDACVRAERALLARLEGDCGARRIDRRNVAARWARGGDRWFGGVSCVACGWRCRGRSAGRAAC